MASSVKKEDIKKLREAGYLSKDTAHRLQAEGQIKPTPKPQERVVFLSHFIRGLGFPLHPFVCGLMFYYGLDFHDLAPNFIINISAFISCARPSSASRPTSAYGSRLSMSSRRWCTAPRRSAEVPWWVRCPMSYGSRAPLWSP